MSDEGQPGRRRNEAVWCWLHREGVSHGVEALRWPVRGVARGLYEEEKRKKILLGREGDGVLFEGGMIVE